MKIWTRSSAWATSSQRLSLKVLISADSSVAVAKPKQVQKPSAQNFQLKPTTFQQDSFPKTSLTSSTSSLVKSSLDTTLLQLVSTTNSSLTLSRCLLPTLKAQTICLCSTSQREQTPVASSSTSAAVHLQSVSTLALWSAMKAMQKQANMQTMTASNSNSLATSTSLTQKAHTSWCPATSTHLLTTQTPSGLATDMN